MRTLLLVVEEPGEASDGAGREGPCIADSAIRI